MLLIYYPDLGISGARRSSGTDEIELPTNYIGKELHIYIAFKANNGKSISDSVYVKS